MISTLFLFAMFILQSAQARFLRLKLMSGDVIVVIFGPNMKNPTLFILASELTLLFPGTSSKVRNVPLYFTLNPLPPWRGRGYFHI